MLCKQSPSGAYTCGVVSVGWPVAGLDAGLVAGLDAGMDTGLDACARSLCPAAANKTAAAAKIAAAILAIDQD